MAYTINKTDGTILATITDGTTNTTATNLTLIGKSYSGWGENLNENLVRMLENAASTSSPTTPLRGQLWFDVNNGALKVYNGTQFEPAGGAQPSASVPSAPGSGDLWMDSTNDQVFVYTGDSRSHQVNDKWELVGPAFTAGQTESGWKIETLASGSGNKVVSSMYAGSTRVAILSKETFTPTITQTGFASIKAGITLNSTLSAVFEGTNTSSTFVDVSGTTDSSSTLIAGGNFLRANASDTTTGALTIDNDTGIIIGDSQDLTISVSSNDVTIAQTEQDKDLIFTVNDGGSTVEPMRLVGSTSILKINDTGLSLGTGSDVTMSLSSDNLTIAQTTSDKDIIFTVNDGGSTATLMTLDGSESRVGIGTASPSTTLEVDGTVKATQFEGIIAGSGSSSFSSLTLTQNGTLIFEGSADDAYETTLTVANPTADRTITLPNVTGTVVTTGDSGTVASGMFASGVTLQILNSSGSALKTIHGAGA